MLFFFFFLGHEAHRSLKNVDFLLPVPLRVCCLFREKVHFVLYASANFISHVDKSRIFICYSPNSKTVVYSSG